MRYILSLRLNLPHLIKPCLIHVEFVLNCFGWLGLASGFLNISGLDIKFSFRNELMQNTTEWRDIDLSQPGILPHIYK